MNPLKSSLHRTAAVFAGALIGVAGAAVFAAPASAHTTFIDGETACVNPDRTWEVTWKVTNSEADIEGVITAIGALPKDSTISGINVGDVLPVATAGSLTATQVLPADSRLALVRVTAEWTRGDEHRVNAENGSRVRGLRLPACGPKPSPTPTATTPSPDPTTTSPDPDPTTTSPDPDPTTTSPDPEPTTTSPDPEPTTTSPDPDPTTTSPDPDPTTTSPDPDPTTTSPDPDPTTTSPDPEPTTTSPDPDPTTTTPDPEPTGTFPDPDPTTSQSSTPSPSPTNSGPSPITEPEFVYETTCDTITVGVDNPADFEELTVTFTPSVGDAQTIVAPPGQVTVVDFPASEGLTIVATPKGYEDEAASITYEAPAECSAGGGGGALPVTGAAAGGIAGGAAILLGIGAVLFVMARRRKVKFTA